MNLRLATTDASANPLTITDIRCVHAGPKEAKAGLVAWISFTLGGRLRIDGVTLRRTRGGRIALSFPAKQSLTGAQFFFVRPLDDAARKHVERQVFQALGLEGGAGP